MSFAAIVDRALNGHSSITHDFEFGIRVPNLRRVVKKYGVNRKT